MFNNLRVTPLPSSWCSTSWEWLRPSRQGVQHHRSDSVPISMVFNTLGVTPLPSSGFWSHSVPIFMRTDSLPLCWTPWRWRRSQTPKRCRTSTLWRGSAREHFTECSSLNGPNQEGFVMLHAEINGAKFLIIWFIAKARRRKYFQSTCQFNVRLSSQIFLLVPFFQRHVIKMSGRDWTGWIDWPSAQKKKKQLGKPSVLYDVYWGWWQSDPEANHSFHFHTVIQKCFTPKYQYGTPRLEWLWGTSAGGG
jgi:hypothetical protein